MLKHVEPTEGPVLPLRQDLKLLTFQSHCYQHSSTRTLALAAANRVAPSFSFFCISVMTSELRICSGLPPGSRVLMGRWLICLGNIHEFDELPKAGILEGMARMANTACSQVLVAKHAQK